MPTGSATSLVSSVDPVTLYSFASLTSGASPGPLRDGSGDIFGTTFSGGASNDGTVFEMTPRLGGFSFSTLATFNGPNGEGPSGTLVEDASGDLFGTTRIGGSYYASEGSGSVFELVKGSNGYTLSTLASFHSDGGGANPTGTITFLDGTTILGTASLSAGTAIFITSALAVGSHSITAAYGGDIDNTSSTSPLVTHVVNKDGTNAVLTSSANPGIFGTVLTFTASITASSPGSGTPTGTVTFYDGTSPLATQPMAGGLATFTTSALAVGTHSITAIYSGDGNFTTSVSPAVAQVVYTPVAVQTVVVNSNQTQRSMVTSIQIFFTSAVDTTLLKSAFSLIRTGLPNKVAGDNAVIGNISVAISANGMVATLTFSGANTEGGSLADGNWKLSIDHTKVVSNGEEMAADYQESGIKRLFGDLDGNGSVDSTDLGLFGMTFGLATSNLQFMASCDGDANGIDDSIDLGGFGTRFGSTL